MLTPLLTTKLHIPPVRPTLVTRPRLIDRICAEMHHKLTLVCAPAGFGKTTLLSEVAGRCGRPVAWLSLDESDNDPTRFLAYLIAALQSVKADIGQGALSALQSPQPPALAPLLVGLINELASVLPPFLLALDDYHLIEARPIHDALAFLLDHQPSQMHLVLATRADPPLPLPRLRARGHLTELRQSDLRFRADEAAAFLNSAMRLSLSAEHVAALEARTEGWIAGLQMAALSLEGHSHDPSAQSEFVQAFTGSHRFVLDYLAGEVLDQQPAAIQGFLLRTSILERLTAPLCDALSQPSGEAAVDPAPAPAVPVCPDSQSLLEHLEAANLFIVPLDDERRWYRYHRLFADLLHKRLLHTCPNLEPTLHRRASEWHEQQGLIAAAVEHALAAHDAERALRLIESSVEVTLMRSEIMTFLNWVGRLPDEMVRSRPILCFYHAWALLMSGRSLDAVEQRLHDAACSPEAPESTGAMTGRLAALRAYVMVLQADTHRAAELCRQALEHLPEGDRFLRSVVAWILSMARLDDVSLEDGSQALQEVAWRGQEMGNPLIAVAALCNKAKLQVRQGRLLRARDILERALQLSTDVQGRRLPIASRALVGLGDLKREWNELDAAAEYLTEGIELAGQWSELAAFDACFPLMRTRLAQGNRRAARRALESARQLAGRSEATEIDDLVADLQEAHLLIAEGDMGGAVRWAERRGLAAGPAPEHSADRREGQDLVCVRLQKYERLVLARLYVCQGQAAEAINLLQPLLAQARKLGRIDLTIDIQILAALAYRIDGREAPAMDALAEALSLAEPSGYVRTFLDHGQSLRDLIADVRSAYGAPGHPIDAQERGRLLSYADRLLAAFSAAASPAPAPAEEQGPKLQDLVEPLSKRELQVLTLLATGLSNPEIAGELVVAESTVHSHCKSIYGKLSVHRRWDAVRRAQELGLI